MRLHQNRISRNVEKKQNGWNLFLKKWNEELDKIPTIKNRVYASYNWEMGRVYYFCQQYSSARKHLFKVIRYNKLKLKAYILLLASLLRVDIRLK
ncbi:hypothetical protein QA601_10660 [Chitinispirillales bacterium ANBcel5]|uniref:hypothetical protein n=1 Tax=Cellulosispirillum alkaliphilum TaxID=3039283 RepID=UPI002A5981E6|nr:hypothetical protein [Chitinispirillales bacterium ANBcel5]